MPAAPPAGDTDTNRGRGRRRALILTLALTLVPAASGLAEPGGSARQQQGAAVELPAELDRVLRDYEVAWRARDAAALAELFAEDGFVLPNGRPPVRGRDAIRGFYEGHGGPLHLRALAYAMNGDVAYIIGGYRGQPEGADGGKFTLTLRRETERWLIFSDMDSSNRRGP